MKLEVRRVSLGSLVFSAFPLVAFFFSLLAGFISFEIIPGSPQVTLWLKVLRVGFFALIYCVIITALAVFFAFVYNLLTGTFSMPGVKLELEEEPQEEGEGA